MVNRRQTSLELTLLVFIMSLFIIGVGIYGVFKIGEFNNSSKELYTDRIVPMDQLADIRFYTSNIIATARQIDGRQIAYSEALQKITQSQDSIQTNWKNFQQSYLTDTEKQLVLKTKFQIDQANATIEKLKFALKKEDANLLDSILEKELYSNLNSVIIQASNLLQLQVKIGKAINQNNYNIYKNYTSEISWILLIAILFALPFSYYLIKKNSTIISNLKLNDAKLFLTEKNYRNLIEYAGEAILIIDEESKIIDLNEVACVLFGYTREELLEINISKLVPPDEVEMQLEDVELIRRNKSAQLSRKIKRKDGSFVEIEVSSRSMDGKGFFAIIYDVTERKNAEEILKKSEEKYRYLFDNNPAYIIIWDLATLEVLEINNAVLSKYGFSKDEWTKMSVLDYRPEEEYSKIKEFAQYMLVNDEPIVTRNWKHYKKNGEEMIMEIASHKIDYNNRKAILSLANDVTDSKVFENELIRYNAELKKTNTELDRFVYSASHDLRAPLKSMLGLIYITSDDIKENENLDNVSLILERLDLLNQSVSKLDNFIEDILNYSRNARLESIYEEIDIEDLVNEVKKHPKFADEKPLDFNFRVNSKQQFVSDYQKLKVVLNNVISNAFKYSDATKENSFVNIIFTADTNKATIIVEDNGIGIGEKDRQKIFDMFYRSSIMSTGSGLGLYIVKEVIEKLGGTISVESESGKNTKFCIEIPNQINLKN